MPIRDGYIPGVPCWVEASEPDANRARDFYGPLFGWEFESVMPSSEGEYFIARGESKSSSIFDTSGDLQSGDVAAIRSIPGAAQPTARWNTYFWVDSADEAATAARATELGGRVIVPPFDAPWSTPTYTIRITVITDPQGATFSASKFVAER